MYSVMFSRIETGMNLVKDRMIDIVPKNSKVAVFPWTFPIEINAEKLNNEFFKKGKNDIIDISMN